METGKESLESWGNLYYNTPRRIVQVESNKLYKRRTDLGRRRRTHNAKQDIIPAKKFTHLWQGSLFASILFCQWLLNYLVLIFSIRALHTYDASSNTASF